MECRLACFSLHRMSGPGSCNRRLAVRMSWHTLSSSSSEELSPASPTPRKSSKAIPPCGTRSAPLLRGAGACQRLLARTAPMILGPPARPRLPVLSVLGSLPVGPVCFQPGRGFSGAQPAAAGGEAWLDSTEQPPELMHMGGTSDSEFEVRQLPRWSCCPVRPQDFLPGGFTASHSPRTRHVQSGSTRTVIPQCLHASPCS